MRNYKIVSEEMHPNDDDVVKFFEGEHKWVEEWQEGIGRGLSTYDVFTDGSKYLLRAEHYGFDDTYYRCFFVEPTECLQ